MANLGVDVPGDSSSSSAAILAALLAIQALLTGAERTPEIVTAIANGSTVAGKQSVSLLFRGTGGTLDGQAVPNGFVANYAPNKGADTVGSIDYTVPTAGAQQVIITYVGV